MIVIDEGYLSIHERKHLYKVLNEGGLIRVGKHAFTYVKGDRYDKVSVSIVGEEVDEKVMFIGKKVEKKKKVIKKSTSKVGTIFDI